MRPMPAPEVLRIRLATPLMTSAMRSPTKTLLRATAILALLASSSPRAARGPLALAACVSRSTAPAAAHFAAVAAQAHAIACARLADRVPGAAIAVAVDGQIVWSEAFGYADLEDSVAATPASQFRIGSVSKPLTADALAQLVEAGRLDLDVPIQRYVPSFPDKGYPITTRLLGGHLSGIRHYLGDEFLLNRHFASVLDGLAIFKDDSLLFPPGTRFSYSSYGWNLISAAIEGASGEEFLAYMGRHVFRPLGLTGTAPDRSDSVMPRRTRFYDRDPGGRYRISPTVDNSYKWAGGGFVSTAEDLVRFGSAHLHPGWLRAGTLELLFTPQHTTSGEQTEYGIGWFVARDTLGHRVVYHGGGAIGGTTVLGVDRDSRVVIAIVSNLTEADLDAAHDIRLLFDRAVSSP